MNDGYARPQRLVDIGGGRRINVCLTGEGAPTAILAPGLGGTTLSWADTQRRLARTTQVLAYDRAGFGFSDAGPLPRTTDNIVADLRAVLKALDVRPPYILVGHSAGSYDVRMFAFRHPEEVAGMVLVDPSSEHQTDRFAAISGGFDRLNAAALALYRRCGEAAANGTLTPDAPDHVDCFALHHPDLSDALKDAYRTLRLSPALWQAWASELECFSGESARQLRAASHSRGTMPLLVLTAAHIEIGRDIPDEMTAKLRAAWFGLHEELAALSSRGERRMVAAGHNIQLEQPALVAAAIGEIIAQARAGA
ncbi:MAG: alpha/beta fold hydrolase [Rhizomicrobium sp.]